MALMKIIALVLGSAWFFPVSCTTGLVAGVRIVEALDARDVARGDQVHPITLVAEPGSNGQAFRVVRLYEVPKIREKGEAHFLMSRPSGRIDVSQNTFVSYRVLLDLGSEQVIEVQDQNDDRTIWGTYRAARTDVTPMKSRMVYFGYIFTTFPYAFGTALALYGIGRYLRRRLNGAKETSHAS